MSLKLIDQHVQSLKNKGKTENTISTYKGKVQNFLLDIGKDFVDITQPDIDQYFENAKKYLKPSSYNVTVMAIRSFLKAVDTDLKANQQALPINKVTSKIPTKPQVRKVMKKAISIDPGFIGVRNKTIIAVLYYTGIRLDEAYRIHLFDIKFHEQMLHIPQSKNGTSRDVPISKALMTILLNYLKLRNSMQCSTNDLFVSCGKNHSGKQMSIGAFRQIVKRCFKNAEIGHFAPYSLRHLFATSLIKSGISIVEIARLMGHKNANSVLDYYVHDNVPDVKAVEVL